MGSAAGALIPARIPRLHFTIIEKKKTKTLQMTLTKTKPDVATSHKEKPGTLPILKSVC